MFMAAPAALGYIKMVELHDYVQFYLVVILFFVLWFYLNILLDFSEFNTRQEPIYALEKTYTHIKARGIAHIGWLEVVWTIIPIFILTAIAIPSFKLLYALDVVNSPLVTLKCIGNQWYWTYESDIVKPTIQENIALYLNQQHFLKLNTITEAEDLHTVDTLPFRGAAFYTHAQLMKARNLVLDAEPKNILSAISYLMKISHQAQDAAESFAIDSYMLDVDELQLGAFRLLEVDNYPKLPADAEIRIAVTGTDVIHSYAVPSLGIKIDAIPGRLNQFGIRVRSPGTYYGQCSELCGVGHGFMPIKIQFIKFIK
jgi:heme/copper-type cytochrome/quinol oxidase subunit 2